MTGTDHILNPGETHESALLRRVKMHEFLMTGGVQEGYNGLGQMTYSDPITLADYPECPWHEAGCEAWAEIQAGRGHWTRLESDLADAKFDRAVLDGDETEEEILALDARIDSLMWQLELRPRDALALRSRTSEQIAEEKAHVKASRNKLQAAAEAAKNAAAALTATARHEPNWALRNADGDVERVYCVEHKPTRELDGTWTRVPAGRSVCVICGPNAPTAAPKPAVYAPAGPKTGGNPWDRDASPGSGYTKYEKPPVYPVYKAPELDARDDAIIEFALGNVVPDEIVIDGDEGEEGDEG